MLEHYRMLLLWQNSRSYSSQGLIPEIRAKPFNYRSSLRLRNCEQVRCEQVPTEFRVTRLICAHQRLESTVHRVLVWRGLLNFVVQKHLLSLKLKKFGSKNSMGNYRELAAMLAYHFLYPRYFPRCVKDVPSVIKLWKSGYN